MKLKIYLFNVYDSIFSNWFNNSNKNHYCFQKFRKIISETKTDSENKKIHFHNANENTPLIKNQNM